MQYMILANVTDCGHTVLENGNLEIKVRYNMHTRVAERGLALPKPTGSDMTSTVLGTDGGVVNMPRNPRILVTDYTEIMYQRSLWKGPEIEDYGKGPFAVKMVRLANNRSPVDIVVATLVVKDGIIVARDVTFAT